MTVRNLVGILRDQIARVGDALSQRDQVIREILEQVESERKDGKIHDSSAERIRAIAARAWD